MGLQFLVGIHRTCLIVHCLQFSTQGRDTGKTLPHLQSVTKLASDTAHEELGEGEKCFRQKRQKICGGNALHLPPHSGPYSESSRTGSLYEREMLSS